MRSAYDWTSVAGEPLYTTSCPGRSSSISNSGGGKYGVGCHDYIFYSRTGLKIKRVLLPPPISQLMGRENLDPNQPFISPDNYWSSYNGSDTRPFGSFPLPLRSSGTERFTVPDRQSILSIGNNRSDNHDDDSVPVDHSTEINSDIMNVLEIASARRKLQKMLDLSRDFTGYRPINKAVEEKQKYGKKKEVLQIENNTGSTELWIGESWLPYSTTNPVRTGWLPTETFCSTHIALCAEISIVTEALSSEWR